MKTLLPRLGLLALLMAAVSMLAPVASAQQLTRLSGAVLDFDAKPYPDVVITITNKGNGTKYTVTTDKDGKFKQNGLAVGTYDINFKKDNVDYTETLQINGSMADVGAIMNVNFKDIAAKTGYDVNAAKKAAEKNAKVTDMANHFKAGRAAMDDAGAVKQQLRTTPADQRGALQTKLSTDYQTAVSEFEQAQQNAPDNDPNMSTILGNLGLAYDGAGQYDKAVDALQKTVALKPDPAAYAQLGTDLAHEGKMADADAACDKAGAVDPTNKAAAANCYKNMGIVLTNAGKMVDAVAPLQKASELDPNDALTWYLLGNSLMNEVSMKKEGTKEIYVIPPGTAEAYQKCLKLDPNGPHAAEAKASLDSINQLKGTAAPTTVTEKKKKP
ncbi:MAG: carboxypeptidase regulatory-like domain-containing protein [Candidatus Acidiferrales bacterium]